MSGPLEHLNEPSEITAKPSVDSASTRIWTTPSNASAYSNSKKSRISNVFGNKKNKSRAVAYARVSSKRQAEEGVSLDARVERLLAYAEFRGLELDSGDIYIIPNWREQDIIDYMRHRHYAQGWSGNKIAKQLNELKVKGKKGGSWTSSMVLRTCRYQFHENRNMFDAPEWWGTAEYHDSVSW